jgi:glycerol-1-phosphate dehydrogenase [NAD(P)+]
MYTDIPYLVTQDAVPALLEFCAQKGYRRLFLVADPNTYRVLGQRAEAALVNAGFDVKRILLTGEEIATDEHYVTQAMIETNGEDRQFVAVGSGTVTDITRFVSHRARASFVSLPTAPSVDGYTSTVAPMVVAKYKGPIQAQPPVAVFADLPTLCAAPSPLIAAGLGDLLGKYTSLADWQLGALLYDEPFDPAIDAMMRNSVDDTVAVIDALTNRSCEGITRLMDGLVGSGFGMLAFGDSRPASGSEHHIAHFWEIKFILENRPAVLHGTKVGIATLISARRYELLRQMTREDAAGCLAACSLPGHDEWLAEISAGYGPVTEKILAIQEPLLRMNEADLQELKTRILANWESIQSIARTVPHPDQIAGWLTAVGGPTTPAEVGLGPDEVTLGIRSAHYLRDRFTLNRLGYWLKLPFGTA